MFERIKAARAAKREKQAADERYRTAQRYLTREEFDTYYGMMLAMPSQARSRQTTASCNGWTRLPPPARRLLPFCRTGGREPPPPLQAVRQAG